MLLTGAPPSVKTCFLRACRAWRAPGPWLGCGIACLRLEQWEEAEDALHHASRLDCNSPSVWGNIALLLLSLGEDRYRNVSDASVLSNDGNSSLHICASTLSFSSLHAVHRLDGGRRRDEICQRHLRCPLALYDPPHSCFPLRSYWMDQNIPTPLLHELFSVLFPQCQRRQTT